MVLVTVRKAGIEPRQDIIELSWADGEVPGQRNVDPSADHEVKGVVAGRCREDAVRTTGRLYVRGGIAMGSAKSCLHKRLELLPSRLYTTRAL